MPLTVINCDFRVKVIQLYMELILGEAKSAVDHPSLGLAPTPLWRPRALVRATVLLTYSNHPE